MELQAHGAGNKLMARSRHYVNQEPDLPDITPPRMVWGEIDGDRMTIYFSEPLDEDAVGGYFSMYWGGTNSASSNIEISGNKVTVYTARAWVGVSVSTVYVTRPADPTVKSLRDLAGNVVRTPYRWFYGDRTTRSLYLSNITGPPYVTGVAISSDAGDDRFYLDGDDHQE